MKAQELTKFVNEEDSDGMDGQTALAGQQVDAPMQDGSPQIEAYSIEDNGLAELEPPADIGEDFTAKAVCSGESARDAGEACLDELAETFGIPEALEDEVGKLSPATDAEDNKPHWVTIFVR